MQTMQKSKDVPKPLSVNDDFAAQNSLENAVLSAFNYLKNCLDDDLVSFPSFCFLFRELKIHKIAIFLVLRLQCFVQPAKNFADPLLTAKSG